MVFQIKRGPESMCAMLHTAVTADPVAYMILLDTAPTKCVAGQPPPPHCEWLQGLEALAWSVLQPRDSPHDWLQLHAQCRCGCRFKQQWQHLLKRKINIVLFCTQ